MANHGSFASGGGGIVAAHLSVNLGYSREVSFPLQTSCSIPMEASRSKYLSNGTCVNWWCQHLDGCVMLGFASCLSRLPILR